MPDTSFQNESPKAPGLARRRGGGEPAPGGHYLLLGALLGILAVFMLYPLVGQIAEALSYNGRVSLYWLAATLKNETFRSQLAHSLGLAFCVTILCNLIAFPLALIGRRYDFFGKGILGALVLVPMVLPPFVGAIGMKQLLGRFGSLTVFLQHLHILRPDQGIDWLGRGGFWALVVLISLSLYPIAYLNLQAALANIDPAMLEAAENLGGRRWTNFRRITLPLAMPGIFAGSTIIFIWAFTELGTPLLLGYHNVVSRSMWDDLSSVAGGGGSKVPYAKAILVLAISATVYLAGKFTFGRSGYAMTSKAAVVAQPRKLGAAGGFLAAAPFLLITFLAVLPHISVLLYSFTAIATEHGVGWGPEGQFGWYRTVIPGRFTLSGYEAIFQTRDIYGAIFNSIKYAGMATALNVILGIAIAWVLVRTRVWGRAGLDALAMLPLAVPGLIMAYGFLAIIGQLGMPNILRDAPFWILVIAYTIRRLPFLVRSATGGLQQTSVTLEEAAANLGASPMKVLWKVTIPLIMASLIAGGLLTFSFALLEVSDSLILAQQVQHYPITKMIYALGSDTSGPENVRNACALGVIAMLFLIVTIGSAALLMGKKLGAVFRA